MLNLRTRPRMARITQGLVAVVLVGGFAFVAPAMASAATTTSSARSAATVQAGSAAASITWSNRHSYSLSDRCGGASGWIQWSGSNVQTYGEVWTSGSSCGGPGGHYVKVTYVFGPNGYEQWSSANTDGQGEGGVAGPNQTVGYNSYVLNSSPWNPSDITVYLCSSEGTGNCNVSEAF
jgi:hypothetical protein